MPPVQSNCLLYEKCFAYSRWHGSAIQNKKNSLLLRGGLLLTVLVAVIIEIVGVLAKAICHTLEKVKGKARPLSPQFGILPNFTSSAPLVNVQTFPHSPFSSSSSTAAPSHSSSSASAASTFSSKYALQRGAVEFVDLVDWSQKNTPLFCTTYPDSFSTQGAGHTDLECLLQNGLLTGEDIERFRKIVADLSTPGTITDHYGNRFTKPNEDALKKMLFAILNLLQKRRCAADFHIFYAAIVRQVLSAFENCFKQINVIVERIFYSVYESNNPISHPAASSSSSSSLQPVAPHRSALDFQIKLVLQSIRDQIFSSSIKRALEEDAFQSHANAILAGSRLTNLGVENIETIPTEYLKHKDTWIQESRHYYYLKHEACSSNYYYQTLSSQFGVPSFVTSLDEETLYKEMANTLLETEIRKLFWEIYTPDRILKEITDIINNDRDDRIKPGLVGQWITENFREEAREGLYEEDTGFYTQKAVALLLEDLNILRPVQ